MSPSSGNQLGALLFLVSLLVFCNGTGRAWSNEPSLLRTPYHTEQEWIISSICRNAFELLAYEKDKKGELVTPTQVVLKQVPGSTLSYDVTVRGAHTSAEATLQWPGSIWAPSAYLPFCQAAARSLQVEPSTSAPSQGNPLHALLDFSEAAIEAENQRVSKWLTAEPSNAAAHEQAALILGVLALKEASGVFYDPRDACNHACAHLAVAQFLRGGASPSLEGRLAPCLIGLIADTQVKNGKDIDELGNEKPASPDISSWLNGARLRNTKDWRLLKNPETATPFEQVQYFAALVYSVNTDHAIQWLQAHPLPDRPDWGRKVIQGGYSVESGHLFAKPSVSVELQTMRATFPGSFDEPHLVDELNRPPGDVLGSDGPEAGTLTVINRGMWAQYFQRHLCDAIFETGFFLSELWGVPDIARQFDQDVVKNYSALVLYPRLQLYDWQFRKMPVDANRLMRFFISHPEWGDYVLRRKLVAPTADAEQLRQTAFQWFTPPFPQGTAYDVGDRLDGWCMTPDDIHRLYAMAPQLKNVAEAETMVRSKGNETIAGFHEIFGPLLEYNLSAMELALRAVDINYDQRFQLGEKAAALDPDGYSVLAFNCLKAGRDDDTAKAYQEYFDKGTNRVAVSNEMEWLVGYYYDHDQKDKAMQIAAACADVYSEGGLETMMRLLERTGRLDEAEAYGQKIEERYNDSKTLAGFYKRQGDQGNAGFKAKFDDLASKAFPEGLKKVELASFSTPPALGLIFTETNTVMDGNGLAAGQVVVALDGYGVQNRSQFGFVWGLSEPTKATRQLIVWDGHSYREVTAKLPGGILGARFEDYHR